jgi:hypothetical protein
MSISKHGQSQGEAYHDWLAGGWRQGWRGSARSALSIVVAELTILAVRRATAKVVLTRVPRSVNRAVALSVEAVALARAEQIIVRVAVLVWTNFICWGTGP